MRIALVCAHFLPKLGYAEVHMARALAGLSHELAVFTTAAVPSYVGDLVKEKPRVGMEIERGYTVHRLPHLWQIGQLVYSPGLVGKVKAFEPDVILVIGIGKYFPIGLYREKPLVPVITILGDNRRSLNPDGKGIKSRIRGMGRLTMRRLFKERAYRMAIRRSDRVFAYTGDALETIASWVKPRWVEMLRTKLHPWSLGFDPASFFYDEKLRAEKRQEMKWAEDDQVILTATRAVPEKNLEHVFDAIEVLMGENGKLRYCLIGVLPNSYGNSLKKRVAESRFSSRFELYDYVDHAQLNGLFNAADAGYWPQAAISIQEAMGAGLPLLLPSDEAVGHLLKPGINGLYRENNLATDLDKLIELSREADRELLARRAEHNLSWPSLVKLLLEGVGTKA